MSIQETTMFVVPMGLGGSGLACNLDLNSAMIKSLLNQGFERSDICRSFWDLFSRIPIEIVEKHIPSERKWWQFYKSKHKTVYEYKNLEFKLDVLNCINNSKPLKKDLARIKTYIDRLPLKTKMIISLDTFKLQK